MKLTRKEEEEVNPSLLSYLLRLILDELLIKIICLTLLDHLLYQNKINYFFSFYTYKYMNFGSLNKF